MTNISRWAIVTCILTCAFLSVMAIYNALAVEQIHNDIENISVFCEHGEQN